MCLVLKKGEDVQLAQKDIICYKNVQETDESTWNGPFYDERKYQFNKVVTAEKKMVKETEVIYEPIEHLSVELSFKYLIHNGFHAFTKEGFGNFKGLSNLKEKYCIIPKGTEICYGDNNDIVAVSMIVFKNKFQFIRYEIKTFFKEIIGLFNKV